MNTLTQTRAFTIPLLVGWGIASTIGITLGLGVTLQILWQLTEGVGESFQPLVAATTAGAFIGLGVGLATGLAQWLILRLRGHTNYRWLVSTVTGSILGAIVAVAISNTFGQQGEVLWVNLVAFALMGAILGTVQLVLSPAIVKHPVWIAASAVGLAGTMALFFGAGATPLGIGSGLIYGVVTAVVLWWIGNK